jgi:hypothetical protein
MGAGGESGAGFVVHQECDKSGEELPPSPSTKETTDGGADNGFPLFLLGHAGLFGIRLLDQAQQLDALVTKYNKCARM